MITDIKGLENIMSNLNKEIEKIKNRSLTGLIKAARVVRDDMDFTPPLIPIDLGNLRKSWFIVTSNKAIICGRSPTFVGNDADKIKDGHTQALQEAKGVEYGQGPYVVFGFGAPYALYVHEMIEAKFQRHGAGALFLSNAMARNSKRIFNIIAKEVKIK